MVALDNPLSNDGCGPRALFGNYCIVVVTTQMLTA